MTTTRLYSLDAPSTVVLSSSSTTVGGAAVPTRSARRAPDVLARRTGGVADA